MNMNKYTLFDFMPNSCMKEYDIRMDFDTLSVPNIMKTFPGIDYHTASCISIASKNQVIRDNLQKDLQNYFSKLYI